MKEWRTGINQIWCVIPIIFVSMASIHNARLFDIYGVRSPFLGEVHAIPPSCFVPSSVYRWWDHCAMPPVSPAIIHLAGVALVVVTPLKYEFDSKNLACVFARSNIVLKEKLTNETLVTPNPRLNPADTLRNNDVVITSCIRGECIITMTSKWTRWRLKSPASRLFTQSFIQTQIKENIKAPRHWPLCGEFTGGRWIPRTKGQ